MGTIPITQTTRVEILRINITIEFDVVGERPATNYIQLSWADKIEWKNCIASNHSPCFLKLPKRNGANHISNFRFSHVNGNYP